MNNTKLARVLAVVSTSITLLVPSIAFAIDWSFTGFIRQEIAVSITDTHNGNNASTNRFTDRPNVVNVTNPLAVPTSPTGFQFNPGATTASTVGDGLIVGAIPSDPTRPAEERGIFSFSPTTCPYFEGADPLGAGGAEDATTAINTAFIAGGGDPCINGGRGQLIAEDKTINMFNTRAEFDIQANNITDRINAYAKLRVYFDGTSNFDDEITGHHFRESFFGNRGNLLEVNSNDILVDIPAFYFDYNKGPLWVRVGQQTIAWGEALFFRVFDVANGLDLRRHFFLDVAAEEYADERVASPGVRVSYTFRNGIELDGFVQMFSPTLLPTFNTTYNLVTSGFSWDNRIELDEAKFTLNYGMRAIWPITDSLTIQAMAVNRRNPDGVTRWHDAPRTLDNGRPNPFCAGRTLAQTVAALNGGPDFSTILGSPFGGTINLSAQEVAMLNGTTPLSRTKYTENGCGSFFAPDALGGNGPSNWYDLAPYGRLDSAAAVAASIDLTQISSLESREGFGLPNEYGNFNMNSRVNAKFTPGVDDAITRFGSIKGAADNTLGAFYTGFGALRGWITREFKRETIFGFGGNYIFTSDNEMLDQLVLRGEMSYTPDKQFTALDLSHNWIEEDEWTASIIAEKYHRWTDAVPAMFMVAEWMFKSESDLFGRHLSGSENKGGLNLNPDGTYKDDGIPDGSDNFNAVVFAFQQPFPNLVWRLDMAFLLDLEGGWFFQPGVRYRPSANFQFDIYANIAQDGGNKNDDIIETIDWADEVFVRATYFF